MTAPDPCTDPVSAFIDAATNSLRAVFTPESICPPLGGGSDIVRFFAGEAAPLAAFQSFGCSEPFLWVRLVNRFRSKDFPTPLTSASCSSRPVAAIEIGAARCAPIDRRIDFDKLATQAETSLDDSWRIERALCLIAGEVKNTALNVGSDTVDPYGPDGGVTAWTGVSYIQY